jgi:hypothetical protein
MIEIDARGMEAPRPFELVMEALCHMAPGDTILLRIHREPFPLYRVLDRNGYRHRTRQCDDGHFEVEIR